MPPGIMLHFSDYTLLLGAPRLIFPFVLAEPLASPEDARVGEASLRVTNGSQVSQASLDRDSPT